MPGIIDGLAILVAVILVVTITSLNNLQKDKQFRVIEDSQVEMTTVVRNGVYVTTL